MTVIKLRDDSLLVHDPVAPTGECLRALARLGVVRHVVLASTAIEHKFYGIDHANVWIKRCSFLIWFYPYVAILVLSGALFNIVLPLYCPNIVLEYYANSTAVASYQVYLDYCPPSQITFNS